MTAGHHIELHPDPELEGRVQRRFPLAVWVGRTQYCEQGPEYGDQGFCVPYRYPNGVIDHLPLSEFVAASRSASGRRCDAGYANGYRRVYWVRFIGDSCAIWIENW